MSNVGFATLQIIPSAKGFGAALSRETDGSFSAAGKAGGAKASKGFSSAFLPGLGGIAAGLGTVFAASKGIDFLKDAVGQASDLTEAGSKLGVVFGDATKEVMAFAKGGSKALGQSSLDVQNAAATFGIYGKAAGLAGSANANFSKDLVSLSTDLASFYNTDPSEAANAIASALRGESEPLRSYGVLLDAATLSSEALKMGLIKTAKEALTPQNKILAAQAVIMRQTSVAQGDFARTSGGLANQQRIAAANMENLKGKIGSVLLPAVLKLTTGFSNLLAGGGPIAPLFTGIQNAISTVTPYATQLFDVLFRGDFTGGPLQEDSPLVAVLFTIREGFATAVQGVTSFFTAFQTGAVTSDGFIGKMQELGVTVSGFVSEAIPLVTSFAASFRDGLLNIWKTVQTNVLPAIQKLAAFVISDVVPAVQKFAAMILTNVVPIVTGWITLMTTKVYPVLAQVAAFILGTLVPQIIGFAVSVATKLQPVLQAVFEVVRESVLPMLTKLVNKFAEWWPTIQKVIGVVVPLIGHLAEFAATILAKVLPPAIKFAAFMVETVFAAVVKVIDVVVKIIGHVIAFGTTLTNAVKTAAEFATGIGKHIGEALDFVSGIPGKVISAVSGIGSTLFSAGADLIRGFINGIKSMAGEIVAAIKSTITDKLPGFVKDRLGIKSPSRVFAQLGAYTAEGFAVGVESMTGRTQSAMATAVTPPTAPVIPSQGGIVGALNNTSAAVAALTGATFTFKTNLDGREIAEEVFSIGGYELYRGRKQF